jgi:hypothetical protein
VTTAGLEPATFWCRWQSKPNALPLRQVAMTSLYSLPFCIEGRIQISYLA